MFGLAVPECTLAPVLRTYSTKITRLRGNLSLHRISDLSIVSYILLFFNRFIKIFRCEIFRIFAILATRYIQVAQKQGVFCLFQGFFTCGKTTNLHFFGSLLYFCVFWCVFFDFPYIRSSNFVVTKESSVNFWA